ncbi:hypothetical protein EDD15DRAFT_2160638 [Pisolithus albus]|nr:hypothetical protein EDD15DRAFT_2160638 [Pisolithus albus]
MSVKPDIVLCGQLDQHTGFAWHNVISFLELTSSAHSAQLRRNITRKAYAVFMSQPSRRFVVALSLARQEFRLHIFDRSGAIHSLGHSLHRAADLFTRIIYTLTFGSPDVLGFDPTFVDPTLSPSILYRPRSAPALQMSRAIYVRETAYTVLRHIYVSHLIRGRGTSSWLVKKGKKHYVVKDYWTHKGRKHTEEQILVKIKGLLGVSQLVEAWTIQTEGADEMTDWLRPAFLVGNTEFETRLHRRLLLSPVGDPLVQFHSLQELVSIFIDIVQVHFVLVDVYNILHRDISINNILMFICATRWAAATHDQEERENVIAEKKFRRGLLIDFDYADVLNAGKQGVSSGDRTGTIPFMAIDLLREYNSPSKDFTHTFSHDLESLIYVLVWICILYQAPNEIRSDRTIEQTCLKHWALAKTSTDIRHLWDQKVGQLSTRSVLSEFTPYFEPLKPAVTRLYKLIQSSCDSGDKSILNHAAVTEVLMDAFNTVTEVSCGAKNAKRTWQRLQKEPAPTGSRYYSEGPNARRRVM